MDAPVDRGGSNAGEDDKGAQGYCRSGEEPYCSLIVSIHGPLVPRRKTTPHDIIARFAAAALPEPGFRDQVQQEGFQNRPMFQFAGCTLSMVSLSE